MTSITIEVSWPPKALSPNSRAHWRTKARQTKLYRAAAMWSARAAMFERAKQENVGFPWMAATARYTFYAPDLRGRDDDNLIGSMKAARDGMVSAGLLSSDLRLTTGPVSIKLDRKRPRVECLFVKSE